MRAYLPHLKGMLPSVPQAVRPYAAMLESRNGYSLASARTLQDITGGTAGEAMGVDPSQGTRCAAIGEPPSKDLVLHGEDQESTVPLPSTGDRLAGSKLSATGGTARSP
eukprot:Skav219180  [mRNA]  locus=scaffold648:497610:501113:- [translate_table: standard]